MAKSSTTTPNKKTAPKKSSKKTDKATAQSASTDSIVADNTVIKLTIPWEQAGPVYKQQVQRSAKHVKKSGFRQGKVPADIAEGMLNIERVIEQVASQLIAPIYQAEIEKQKLQPLGQPDIRIMKADKGSDWELEAHIAEHPEVKITDYKKIAQKAKKEAEKALAQEEKELKKAEKKDARDSKKPAELTDAQKEERIIHAIFKDLIAEIQPKVPELLIRRQTEQELRRLVDTLKQLNIELDSYLERRGQTFEQLSQEMAAQALGQWQLEFILEAISAKVKPEISDEAIKAEWEKRHEGHDHSHAGHDHTFNDSAKMQLKIELERKATIDHLKSL